MNIVIITSSAKALFNLRKELIESWVNAGHKVTAIGDIPPEKIRDKCIERGFDYKSVKLSRNGLNPVADLRTLRELTERLKELKPDRVFCTFAKAISYGAWAANRAGISHVYSLMSGLGSIYRSNSLKIRVIRLIMNRLYKNAFKCSKKVIFQNKDDLSLFLQLNLVPKEKSVIVNGSGVDLQRFEFNNLPHSSTFLFVGRLLKEKGICEYIEAAKIIKKKYPHTRFIAVGDIDTNPSSLQKSEVKQYQTEGLILFEGFKKDVRPFIRQCDIFVLPSYHEGTPRCVLEAMSMGRPIITSDAPGCRETVIEGQNGFLIPVEDAKALAAKMEYLLLNPDVADKMGCESRRIAESKYDVVKINNDYANIMQLD
ncbi:MAG: glycosyltransferase family 4 protein [Muribaculaceae bacterium]|nr:glycosyltransferase family 4 protein [Muribaculaceae bacterium]